MNYEVKDEKNCKKVITVTLDAADVAETEKKIFESFKKNAAIDGYRKGKAPEEMIRKRYKDAIAEEVRKEIVPAKGSEVLEKLDLHLVTYPAVGDVKEENNGFTFKIIAEVNSEFELKNHDKIKIEKKELKAVTPEDIDREINKIRQARGVLKDSAADTVKDNDYVQATVAAFIDGKAEPDLSGENQMYLAGEKTSYRGIEKGLVGMKAGEEKDIEHEFPKDYTNRKFAGKKAVFKTKILKIKELEVPEVNDEFAKSLGGFETAEALKEAVKKELAKQAEAEVKNHNTEQLFKYLLDNNTFEVAEGLVEQELGSMLSRYESNLAKQGLSLQKLGVDLNRIKADMRVQAAGNVRLRYILREAAKKEGVEVTDAEMENEIRKIAEATKENPEDMIKRAKQSWEALKAQLTEDRVIESLLKKAGA
jgi:trigger factor